MSNSKNNNLDAVQEVKGMSITFDEAIKNAATALSIQDKVNFIVNGAINLAENQGSNGDLRTKCGPFFTALQQGSEIAGLTGSWYSLVTNGVAGFDHWCMITSMMSSGIIDGSDGCRYYAAYKD